MINFLNGLAKLEYLDVNSAPVHQVMLKGKSVNFAALGEYNEFRIRTALTKEPETIKVISELKTSDCYWDIGANVGIYSILAASMGASVISIEPSPANFFALLKNVEINKTYNILALPIGLSNHNGMTVWNPCSDIAYADNQIVEKLVTEKTNVGLMVRTIDSLIFDDSLPPPTHIKIDVDGIERLILLGGEETLKSKSLKFIQVEVDESDDSALEITEYLMNLGFSKPVMRHPPYYNKYYYAPQFNYFFYKNT